MPSFKFEGSEDSWMIDLQFAAEISWDMSESLQEEKDWKSQLDFVVTTLNEFWIERINATEVILAWENLCNDGYRNAKNTPRMWEKKMPVV